MTIFRDKRSNKHFILCTTYEDNTFLTRCEEDGYYYALTAVQTQELERYAAEVNPSSMIAYLEDKEQGRLGYLMRDF